MRTHPAVRNFFFFRAQLPLCHYPTFRLPCCARIFFRAHSCCALKFFCADLPCCVITLLFAYPAVRNNFFFARFSLTLLCAKFFFVRSPAECAYPAELTLLCPKFFRAHSCCSLNFFVRTSYCALILLTLTLLCLYFSTHLPCCAIIFLPTYPGTLLCPYFSFLPTPATPLSAFAYPQGGSPYF